MLSYTILAVTAADATTYMEARGKAAWPADADDRTEALRRGQDYIAREYNERWAEEWENDDAPELVQFAIYEAALAEAVTPGLLSPTVKAIDAKILTKAPEVEWTPVGGLSGVSSLKPRLMHIEALLRPVLTATGTVLVRA
ncbi:MAG: DnaT-like ssDNA-binding protein [Candidatus Binatia bacterium]